MRAWLAAWGLAAAMGVASLSATSAVAAQDTVPRLCNHERVAQVPLRDDGGYLSIVVSIAGHDLSALVDTGSDGGLLTPDMVGYLRLRLDPDHETVIHGTGGMAQATPNALVPDLRVGGVDFGARSVPVGELPGQPMIHPPVAGLLGGDILSRFDLDMNVSAGMLTLWNIQHRSMACAPPPAWDGPYETVPLHRQDNRFLLEVKLDGRPVTALLDSGARSRIVSPEVARRAGVSQSQLDRDPGGVTASVDGHKDIYHWHRFDSLQVGHELERNVTLTVAPLREHLEMLLGSDWFATHQVWISYATNQIFIRPTPRQATR
ncbi:retroviral-like aspartic protease family protein [Komagataeibacter europaeus]|uniref:retroviral-like aspartic protease family protein n=1 Tax=Komagataeibacter europaeus TaxID=33995 RepID=UPI0002F0983E|nr:retroviral-like aspartic protease family protein [Komagataeibacter europaeus]